jgi:glutathione S-transferase
LDRLERDLLEAGTDYFLGDSLSHPDIMSTCAWRFGSEAHASLFVAARWPTLAALAARCEQLPVFQAVYQPIVNNLSNG